MMPTILPIHPFPARMAPEIALDECASLLPGSLVLDPMTGSGTVMRMVAMHGHRGVGFDIDPLAVLMTKVWTSPIDVEEVQAAAERIVASAKQVGDERVELPWIDGDAETQRFVEYWFAERQRRQLRAMSRELTRVEGAVGDALKIGLSRIIITKERGASLARDVSHSRPHRVRTESDFSVYDEFLSSVRKLTGRLEEKPLIGTVQSSVGDARRLTGVESGSVDAVITSPPYLNAIDYMRGHRLSLVWLGYSLAELRRIRSNNIGAERGPAREADLYLVEQISNDLAVVEQLPSRQRGIFQRYVLDLYHMIREVSRVLRPGGRAVFVVGNSCLRGVFVGNASVVAHIAAQCELDVTQRRDRELPASKRYLPPPSASTDIGLAKRMQTETVISFVRH